MPSGLFELAVVFLVAALLGIAAKVLKQPIILAYLATGLVIGYFGFFNLNNKETFQVFADLGIMFLLFLVGLEINYTSLRLVGKSSLIVGLGQIIFTFVFGYFIAQILGFSGLQAAYISIALTFSSTIIVVKLLSEKKDLNSLYGKLSIGFLLVQDVVAILLLIFLAGIETGRGLDVLTMVFTVLKGILLFILILWLGRKVLPSIFDMIARSQELLFLTSLAWVFLMVAAVAKAGLSIEIGGFLAGIALANSSERFQIAGRIKPLRDFFILIFFVILGSSIVFSPAIGFTLPVIAFSLFVLIGNPLIVLIIMGLMGYRRRTSFMAGLTVAQISEFSLVLVVLGERLGHVTGGVVALITAVGIVTIALSTYFIVHGEAMFRTFRKYLRIFERRKVKEQDFAARAFKKSIILVGFHRTGQSIGFNLPREKLLIIEFDPEIIHDLKKHGFDYIFGDITDPDVFERANFKDAHLVISTSPDLEDNLYLLKQLMLVDNKAVKKIVRAENEKEAEILYKEGADYVLLPHFTAGQYLGKTIAIDPEMKVLGQLRKRDLETMRQLKYMV